MAEHFLLCLLLLVLCFCRGYYTLDDDAQFDSDDHYHDMLRDFIPDQPGNFPVHQPQLAEHIRDSSMEISEYPTRNFNLRVYGKGQVPEHQLRNNNLHPPSSNLMFGQPSPHTFQNPTGLWPNNVLRDSKNLMRSSQDMVYQSDNPFYYPNNFYHLLGAGEMNQPINYKNYVGNLMYDGDNEQYAGSGKFRDSSLEWLPTWGNVQGNAATSKRSYLPAVPRKPAIGYTFAKSKDVNVRQFTGNLNTGTLAPSHRKTARVKKVNRRPIKNALEPKYNVQR